MDGSILSAKSGKLLVGSVDKKGYRKVQLYRGSRSSATTIKVCAAVLLAYLGPRPDGAVILHADDDKRNDSLANLGYGTPSQNQMDSVRNGTHSNAAKVECKNGHPLLGSNLKVRCGRRVCITCERDYQREYKRRVRAVLD